MINILIVEDDRSLNAGVKLALRDPEYVFYQAYQIEEARKIIQTEKVDLVLLDLNLPDGNGLDFLTEIKESLDAAVIVLTANDMELDIVTGLELGADDYVTKPFSLMVLRARVNTELRKREELRNKRLESTYRFGEYSFDFVHMKFYKEKMEVELSKTEQKLLKILVENKNQTVPRGSLVDRIWTDGAEYVDENALSVTVNRLRSKLMDTGAGNYIKTVYGIGYMWVTA
ncbi:MAG: response regulator transcription factor [Lachnospiraceae bacterium]|nr:response regulator transcription factor [Lachnospiraceae bacterium]